MGSGKSTLGALLAEKLNWGFLDTDVAISQEVGLDIGAIFLKHGQDYFRGLEGRLIQQISQQTCLVVATGGGMPIFHPLEGLGEIIYLHADFEVILARLQQDSNPRPLFENTTQLHTLYTQRHPFYARMATHTLNANQCPSQVLNQLLELVSNIYKI